MPHVKDIKCIVLDIEGTVCPISFVKTILFPYALKALPGVLASEWEHKSFRSYRDAFPEGSKESPEVLQSHVEDLTKRDVKVAYLKNLQGYLWENGYRTRAYSTPLFQDVAPQLKQWKHDGFQLAIYSSGSVFAQKLLFGHVKKAEISITGKRSNAYSIDESELTKPPRKKHVQDECISQSEEPNMASDQESEPSASLEDNAIDTSKTDQASNSQRDTNQDNIAPTEDLQDLISDWFDTANAGSKSEATSYETIAGVLNLSPMNILFLSDSVKEVDAAMDAGMRSLLVDRPGNAPVSEADQERLSVVRSLDKVEL